MPKYNKINIVFCLFLIACIVFLIIAPFVLLPKINKAYSFDSIEKNNTFLELWEIDTFEGGTNSRSKFLENTAVMFEQKNSGVYIIVRNLSLPQAILMLQQDAIPDLVSFGVGVGDYIKAYIKELNISTSIRKSVLNSAKLNNKLLALPWCMGGYVWCSFNDINNLKESKVGVAVENNIPPKTENKSIIRYNTQYDAYKDFLSNNYDVLLGSQRDYFRLNNKVSLGAIEKCNFKFNNSYTDLVQYIAITTTNLNNISPCQNFIRFLLEDNIQKRLTNIGMFSVCEKHIYKGTNYAEFENNIMQITNILNAFTEIEEIKEKQNNYN